MTTTAATTSIDTVLPRSNATHIVWYDSTTQQQQQQQPVQIQTLQDAKSEAYAYLFSILLAYDVPNQQSLGFHASNDTDVDGMGIGIVQNVIHYALRTKVLFAYTDTTIPKHIFYPYILNYNNLNEAHTNIREYLYTYLITPLLLPLPLPLHSVDEALDGSEPRQYVGTTAAALQQQQQQYTLHETVRLLNAHLWRMLANRADSITFHAGQTPCILDPMSVLSFGYGSCTGLSILFVEALRAAGVPARVVGTPAWYGADVGNHNWVEVYAGDDHWLFLEPSPNVTTDTLDTDPCRRWFCTPERFNATAEDRTMVYAATASPTHTSSGIHVPLPWETTNTDIAGIDRTAYYEAICSKCGADAATTTS